MSTDNGISEKERYQRYLAGREWGLLKQQVKARSGGICERCKVNSSDAVHHLTYERKYHEDVADLQDTCEACHRFTHGLSDEDPCGQGFKYSDGVPYNVPEAIVREMNALRCPLCGDTNDAPSIVWATIKHEGGLRIFAKKLCRACILDDPAWQARFLDQCQDAVRNAHR